MYAFGLPVVIYEYIVFYLCRLEVSCLVPMAFAVEILATLVAFLWRFLSHILIKFRSILIRFFTGVCHS
jgi:hypothetical protein